MYWIYLILFIFIVFTPEFVFRGTPFLGEEHLESILILGFGVIGLILYLLKETALVRTVREKLFLQRETNQIRKDLTQSYTYIGEMNRRFDIVKNSLLALPTTALQGLTRRRRELYQPIFDATRLLTRSERVRMMFLSTTNGAIIEKYDEGEGFPAGLSDGKRLIETKKFFWEENGFILIRSPEDAFDTTVLLVFEKIANRIEETEIFQILAAEALFLHCIDQKKLALNRSEKGNDEYAHRH